MKRILAVAGLTALLLVAGCRKHHRRHGHGGDDRGWPEANWPAAQMTVNEGATFTVMLTLDRPWDTAVDVALSSNDTSRVTLPATVTFPAGVTTRNVTISTFADADSLDTFVQVYAETLLDINSMGIVLRETAAPLGGALGPVSAGAGRAVLLTDGPDGIWATADDTLAVATGIGGGVPSLVHVTIGAVTPGNHALPVVTGVSDTVLVMTNGPDLTLGTLDDTLVEVGGISGASPAVTDSLVVGRLEASEGRRPVMVGTRAVYVTRGADLITNGDDQFVVLDGIGTGTLTLTSTTLPSIMFDAPGIVVPVDATTVLLMLAGGDFVEGTGDDILGRITGIGGVLGGIGLVSFKPFPGRMGIPVFVAPNSAVAPHPGIDLAPGTADDGVVLVQNMFVAPVPVFLPAGAISTDPEVQLVSPGSDSALVPVRGVDLLTGTADDQVALFTALSAPVPVGPTLLASAFPPAGAAGRLSVLSADSAARIGSGADGLIGTSDDVLVAFTALTGAAVSSSIATAALQPFAPLPLSPGGMVLAGEGADGVAGSADDTVILVSGIGGATAVTPAHPGPLKLSGSGILVPSGGTHFFARTVGGDDAAGTPDDVLSTATVP